MVMTPEATAAIVGGAVGAGLAFLAQLGIILFVSGRERRSAAQVIYAELISNLSAVHTFIKVGTWPTAFEKARTGAWEAYGVRFLTGSGVSQVGSIALAYSAVEGLVSLSSVNEEEFRKDDHSEELRDIKVGLYEVGRRSGLTDAGLEVREILTDDVKAEWKSRQELTREGRPGMWRRMWSRLNP
jgi:hypothetical protein